MTKVTRPPAGVGDPGPPARVFGSAWSAAEREARRDRLMDLRRMDDLVAGPELAGVVQRQLRAWLAVAPAVPDPPATRPRLGLAAPDAAGMGADRERPWATPADPAGIDADGERLWTTQDDRERPWTRQDDRTRPWTGRDDPAGVRADRQQPGATSADPAGVGADRQQRWATSADPAGVRADRQRLGLAPPDAAGSQAGRERRGATPTELAGHQGDHERRDSIRPGPADFPADRPRPESDGSGPAGSRADRERLGLIAGLAQLGAWVAADAGASTAALSAFRLGLRAADRAGDRPLAGHLLGCLAQLSAEDGDPRAALRLARSAQRRAGSTAPSGVRSLLALRLAYAAAVAGLRRDCEEALAVAERAAEKRDARLEPDWLYWFDAAHFAALTGRCHVALGRPAAARPLLESALRTRHLRYRAAAITGSALATACVDAGELEAAAKAATDALVAGVQSGSVRAGRALQGVERHLVNAARASGAARGPGWSTVRDYLQLLDAARPYLPTVGAGTVSKRGGSRSADHRDRHLSTLQDAQEEPRRAGGTGPV